MGHDCLSPSISVQSTWRAECRCLKSFGFSQNNFAPILRDESAFTDVSTAGAILFGTPGTGINHADVYYLVALPPVVVKQIPRGHDKQHHDSPGQIPYRRKTPRARRVDKPWRFAGRRPSGLPGSPNQRDNQHNTQGKQNFTDHGGILKHCRLVTSG